MADDLPPIAHAAWWQVNGELDQQGPGSDASTLRALAALPDLPDSPRIADLGCGPGRQTLALARATGGRVAALDLLPPFLKRLRDRARRARLESQICIAQCDMARPPLRRYRCARGHSIRVAGVTPALCSPVLRPTL